MSNFPASKWFKFFAFIGCIAGWAALLLQLYLIITNRTATVPETLVRYFSFFTILTNILVAICFTVITFSAINSRSFFIKPGTLAAVTVYIFVVGLVYNVVLRFLWKPEGLQRVVDEVLHSFIPVWFLLFWIAFVPKKPLQWSMIPPWLIYPLVYLILILIRGSFSSFYPYPFVNVTELGYGKVLFNSVILTGVFGVLSALIIAVGKGFSRRSAISSSS